MSLAMDARYSRAQCAACLLTTLIPVFYLLGSAVAHGAAILVVILFLSHSAQTKNWTWLREPWLKTALLLWAYIAVRALFTPHIAGSLGRGASWLVYPLFAMACSRWTLREESMQRLLMACLMLALMFLMFDCLLQYLTGSDLFGAASILTAEGARRLTGPLGGPKAGIVLTWFAFPAVALLLSRSGSRDRARGFVFTLVFLAVVFLSGERMALLLALFGFLLLFLLMPSARELLLLFGAAGAVAAALLVYSNPALLERQIASTASSVGKVEATSYGQIWGSALKVVRDYPVFGVGVRQFRDVCQQPGYGATDKDSLIWRCNLHPHHLYLEWLVETGAVGLMLFLAMIFFLLKPVAQHYRRLKGDPVFLGVLIAVILRIWPLSTAVSSFVPWSAIPLWLMTGWLLALKKEDN